MQNIKVTAFTVSELSMENPTKLPPTQIKTKNAKF